MPILTQQAARRENRRRIIQSIAASAGGVLLASASQQAGRIGLAQEDDSSGSGHGRGRGRGGHDEAGDEEIDLPGTAPLGSLEIRIVSDDAGGFVPGELTVDLGQSVTFVNAHSDEHTASGSGFDTGIIPEGGLVTVVLDTPGTFAYACQIHPEMTGKIAVRDANGIVPQPAPATPSAGGLEVEIANLAFTPASISVPPGSTVTWTNADGLPHTVTSLTGAFDSGIFDPGASFTTTFDVAGEFPYQCLLHPTMQGTVIVSGEVVAAGTPLPAKDTTPPPSCEAAALLIVDFVPEAGSALPPLRTLLSLHADGLLTANFAPIGASPALQLPHTGQGTWHVAGDQLAFTLFALLREADGRLRGLLRIEADGRHDADGTLHDGRWTAMVQDALGAEIARSTGTWSGASLP